MNDLLKSDAFTRTRVDTFTGEPRRQWLEYADGVMEPVRREGRLSKKFHGNKRSLDWWTVEKPLDWDPVEAGREVSLNHDYGRPEQAADKPTNVPSSKPISTGAKPAAQPRTLLAIGAQAMKENEAHKGARDGEGSAPTGQFGDKGGASVKSQPDSKESVSSSTSEAAAAGGALGGMVQSNGQHGKGKLVSQDPTVKKSCWKNTAGSARSSRRRQRRSLTP